MKKFLLFLIVGAITVGLVACNTDTSDEPAGEGNLEIAIPDIEILDNDDEYEEIDEPAGDEVEAREIYELDRVYVGGDLVNIDETDYAGASIRFVGELAGGTVIINVAGTNVIAGTNPSVDHPSFADGYWHHHLYAGSTEAGSERINFQELLPQLEIDDNPEATDNTQSTYQRGNLHHVVETGEYRLRFTINGQIHDLMFVIAN